MTDALFVSTERLGWPAAESGFFERAGVSQKHQTYPTSPDEPTATCHLQRAEDENALCGHHWEGLIRVPSVSSFADVPEWTRCGRCLALGTGEFRLGEQS